MNKNLRPVALMILVAFILFLGRNRGGCSLRLPIGSLTYLFAMHIPTDKRSAKMILNLPSRAEQLAKVRKYPVPAPQPHKARGDYRRKGKYGNNWE